jgi:hypothetical protein
MKSITSRIKGKHIIGVRILEMKTFRQVQLNQTKFKVPRFKGIQKASGLWFRGRNLLRLCYHDCDLFSHQVSKLVTVPPEVEVAFSWRKSRPYKRDICLLKPNATNSTKTSAGSRMRHACGFQKLRRGHLERAISKADKTMTKWFDLLLYRKTHSRKWRKYPRNHILLKEE